MPRPLSEQLDALVLRVDLQFRGAAGHVSSIGDALVGDGGHAADALERAGPRLKRDARDVGGEVIGLIARWAPVATDLRLILALMHLSQHEGLIANQLGLISEQLRQIDLTTRGPEETVHPLSDMAVLAAAQLTKAVTAFREGDIALAREVESDDNAIDRLNRAIFTVTVDRPVPRAVREVALRHALIARSIERIGDNAVDVAEQAAFVITNEFREFTDASRTQ